MIRNRTLRRSVALFFLLEMLLYTVQPVVIFALTAGPTAPEFSSFEPVDTTDLVNLATGDFVYNIPLLEVPGPAGGYPLSLSYHAGIMPNEEASWVGLGFNINPGAINRTVNGFPDDHLGEKRTRADVNTGGERNSFYAGVGLPGVSYNLSVSNDSHQGTGVGANVSIGYQIGQRVNGVGLSASLSVGSDGYGNNFRQAGLYLSGDVGTTESTAKGLGVSFGLQTNFKKVSLSSDASFGSLGVSLSSRGGGVTVLAGSASMSQSNSNAGRLTTESHGIAVPIPIGSSGLFLNLGYNYLRYYSDETSDVQMIGTLYPKETIGKDRDNWSFDSYALTDPDETLDLQNGNPERARGGSFPAYDNYSVNAQGLSGSIRPYILQNGTLFRQNVKVTDSDSYLIEYKSASPSFNLPVNFRFKNDFSNTHAYSGGQMIVSENYDGNGGKFVSSTPNVESQPPTDGYNPATNHLAGSKHIEWFTNQEINQGEAKHEGFIDYQLSQNRAVAKYGHGIASQIGGIMITNEEGVTYHFSLPAYNYDESSKTFVKGKVNDVFQLSSNPAPYAYAWLLTAVTGPDFVDRNENGLADKDDWGYWVTFEYGLWTKNYTWRNPAEGFHADLDTDVEMYSTGKKELYFLDAIRTQTHVALFAKSERADSKSLSDSGDAPTFEYRPSESSLEVVDVIDGNEVFACETVIPQVPVSTMKLDAVYLFSIHDFERILLENSLNQLHDLKAKSNEVYLDYVSGDCQGWPTPPTTKSINYHVKKNVLETEDIQMINAESFQAHILRKILFETDYSLANQTVNSFDFSYSNPSPLPQERSGKLTLKELHFLGKAGLSAIPPMKFNYHKNPDYDRNAFDNWGFYKSDFDEEVYQRNVMLSRLTTKSSAQNVDAWSLNEIITAMGSKISIEYESDTYRNAVLYGSSLFIDKLEPLANTGDVKATFYNTVNFSESEEILQGVEVKILGLLRHFGYYSNYPQWCIVDREPQAQLWLWDLINQTVSVKEVGSDYLIFNSPSLHNRLTTPKGRTCVECNAVYISGRTENCFSYDFDEISFIGGNLLLDNNLMHYGGGLRVKALSLTNLDGTSLTGYTYDHGTTSFEPAYLEDPIMEFPEFNSWIKEKQEKVKLEYQNELNKRFAKIFQISREIPAPGVLYGKVTVEEYHKKFGASTPHKLTGKHVYEFQTFEEKLVERIPIQSRNISAVRCLNPFGDEVPCSNPQGSAPENLPVQCFDSENNAVSCSAGPQTSYTPVMINDYTALVGTLKNVSFYDGTGLLIQRTENQYLHTLDNWATFKDNLKTRFNNQGLISEAFVEHRRIRNDNGTYQHKQVFSIKNEFPLVALGQVTKNFKTGIVLSSENLTFDFYNGMPSSVLTSDGYGNKFITESVAAYRVPIYSGMTSQQIVDGMPGMGLRVKNPRNRNMLSQNVSTTTYKTSSTNHEYVREALVSASVSTYSDQVRTVHPGDDADEVVTQPGIWRKQASYSFVGDDNLTLRPDGLYDYDHFVPFAAWTKSDEISAGWQKDGEISLYNVYSRPMEAIDINGLQTSALMSVDQTRVFASANCKYSEFAFTGTEEIPVGSHKLFSGRVSQGEGHIDPSKFHSGQSSLRLDALTKGFQFSLNTTSDRRTFLVSSWVHNSNAGSLKLHFEITASGSNPESLTSEDIQFVPSPSKKAGDWYLFEVQIPVPPNTEEVDYVLKGWFENSNNAGSIWVDDFRICPYDASMISYVYNKWGELTHILNNQNMYTEYRYDQMGRLIETYQETFEHATVKTSKKIYHFGNQ